MINTLYNDMLTVDDVCEILTIGKNTAYHLLKTKQIPSFQIGRTWKIPKAALEEYIMRQCNLDKK